jgi:hypothetical protein
MKTVREQLSCPQYRVLLNCLGNQAGRFMNLLKKHFFCSVLTLLLCLSAANAQSSWTGFYEFEEDGGRAADDTAIFIVHQLEIRETGNRLAAFLSSSGYRTSRDLICTARATGDKLFIYFENYGENNVLEPYQTGDLLLTLERKTEKDKTEILTFWGKFLPVVPKNEKSGKVYLKKTENTKDKL